MVRRNSCFPEKGNSSKYLKGNDHCPNAKNLDSLSRTIPIMIRITRIISRIVLTKRDEGNSIPNHFNQKKQSTTWSFFLRHSGFISLFALIAKFKDKDIDEVRFLMYNKNLKTTLLKNYNL